MYGELKHINFCLLIMKTTNYPSSERGSADFGWLKANYSFSFSNYFNPKNVRFGKLRVLNDDIIAAGAGFATHPHANMEIITIPLKGAIEHKDSTGQSGVIRPNEIQRMSAGIGIEHSEKNYIKNGESHALQIWIFPNQDNVNPIYQQQYFDPNQRINQWQYIVSNKHLGALDIYQNAVLARTTLQKGNAIDYKTHYEGNGVFLFVIDGEISINNQILMQRDALGIEETNNFTLRANKNSELLLIEVPMI